MTKKRNAIDAGYVTCPACRERIKFSVSRPSPRKTKWEDVDFTKPTSVLARELGVTRGTVSTARARFAPATVWTIRLDQKYDWAKVDWTKSNAEIAREIGADRQYVTYNRTQFAPETTKRRKK